MNARGKGYKINRYVSILVLTGLISLLVGVLVTTYPFESTRLPNNTSPITAAAQPVATSSIEQENVKAGPPLTDNPAEPAKWTFMVYIAADDNTLEEAAIGDFMEMASVGSNDNLNIVVQLDRIPG